MRKRKWYLLIVPLFIGIASLLHSCTACIPPDKLERTAGQIDRAVKSMDDSMKLAFTIIDTPVVYADQAGNTIVYHCLETAYYQDPPSEPTGLDVGAISRIIDPNTADSVQDCLISGTAAVLYTKGDRGYLCWTWSVAYSFVIEYTPSVVSRADIFRMAESLYASGGDIQ